ncbi:putative membrane protein [Acinetobacter baumannii 146457]|nr:putative membrane protein [Acinetobacter baumannii 146457]
MQAGDIHKIPMMLCVYTIALTVPVFLNLIFIISKLLINN